MLSHKLQSAARRLHNGSRLRGAIIRDRVGIEGSTLYYVLKDHLGSASVVTDTGGNIVGEDRYYPFGGTRFTTGTMLTDKLFTGQRALAGLGIYNYGARFYSPYINRFLSADTIVPGFANPQSLNRYSYVVNNPLRYTDPTGHMMVEGEGGSHVDYKKFPCADMHGLTMDICRR